MENHRYAERIADFLSDDRCVRHASFYPAGAVDHSAVVITASRVSDETCDLLAVGDAELMITVEPINGPARRGHGTDR